MMVVHAYYIEDTRVRREAEALVAAGKQVDIICLNKGYQPATEHFNGVDIHRCRASRSVERSKFSYIMEYVQFVFLAFLKVSWLFLKIRPKVVMVHNMPNFLVFSALIPRLFGAKVILDMHDVMPELYANLFDIKGSKLEKLLFFEEWLSAAFASRVMTVNTVIEQILSSRIKKVSLIIHNTPDSAMLQITQPAEKPAGEFTLFHHGNIHQRYGLARVLPVVKKLSEQDNSYRLQVHGRGPFYDDIKAQSKTLGISEVCQLNGGFDPTSVGNMLQQADVGLVLNYTGEFSDILLPVKLLEYVACKIPTVCPRIKAVEACFDDEMLFYFDDDEDLARVIAQIKADPAAAAQKAQKAHQRYLSMQWDTEKQRFVSFIDGF